MFYIEVYPLGTFSITTTIFHNDKEAVEITEKCSPCPFDDIWILANPRDKWWVIASYWRRKLVKGFRKTLSIG